MLDPAVIETDHQLEGIADSASGQLARHRWHWTLDETNPDRVSILAYARQVGRSDTAVGKMAKGYAASLIDSNATLEDHISRAGMSEETRAAADAVSSARGIAVDTARTNYRDETRRVRDIARQLAEEHGTSIEEEAPKVAETIVRHERAEREERAERAQKTDLRAIEAEREVMVAKRAVLKAIRALNDVDLDDDTLEMLADAHNSLKAASALLDARLSGKSGTDWDAELARLA